jgi:Bacteriophage head to tail connecting protein
MNRAYEAPAQCWNRLDAIKSPLLRRCERYAALTIPKLVLPQGQTGLSTEQTTDYQSLGAAAVNHLNNRILLALFRPGDPFFRLDPGKKTKKQLASINVSVEDLASALSAKELEAVAVLDQRAIRPKLYQVGRHLIVTGNALMELGKLDARVYGLRNFCVKRTMTGKVHTIAICESMKFDELEPEVRALIPGKTHDSDIKLYRIVCLQDDGSYKMTQAVDSTVLPEKFGGKWPEDKLPFRVVTWDLADEADYATGLVEEHLGDFEALSALSESLLDGTILTTEMRWLVNPGGITSVEDFRKSRNGDAIAGQDGDVSAINGGDPKAVEMAIKVVELYSQRLARAFLLQSAMVRDAERVTAEEIRAIAMELETAFGGVYSQLGLIWQKPVALWCLEDIDLDVRGTDLNVTVLTGLAALSRNTQLEKLRAALSDLAMFEQLPQGMQRRFKYDAIARWVGQGRGIDLTPFLKSDDQVRAEDEQAMKDQATTEAGVAAGQETAKAQAQQGVPAQ